MAVLKVNVGDAVTPDWRNVGCGTVSGASVVDTGFSQSDSSGTPSITLAGIAAGDLLVWVTGRDGDGPSGFTKRQDYDDLSGNNNHLEVWTKTAAGTESTLSTTSQPWHLAVAYCFRGVTYDTSALSAFTASVTSKATPSATAASASVLLNIWKASKPFSGVVINGPGGLSDGLVAQAFGTVAVAAGWELVAAGGTPARTATSSGSQDWISAALVLTAAPLPGRLKLWDGTRWMREVCDDDTAGPDLVPNGDFETDVSGWAADDLVGGPSTFARSTAWSSAGTASFEATGFGGNGSWFKSTAYLPVTPNADYDLAAVFKRIGGTTISGWHFGLAFYTDTSGTHVSGPQYEFDTPGGSISDGPIGGTVTAPADAAYARIFFRAIGTASLYYVDAITLAHAAPERHPLKVNVGTPSVPDWQTVACMTPSYGDHDSAPTSGWFSLVGGDSVEEPTAVYRTNPARSARLYGPGGTGNYALTLTGLVVGHTYRIGCYVRQDAAVITTTSDAFFHARNAAVRTDDDINPMSLATWQLAEATFVADSTTDDLLWQIAAANASPPYDFSVWIADWYVIDEGP